MISCKFDEENTHHIRLHSAFQDQFMGRVGWGEREVGDNISLNVIYKDKALKTWSKINSHSSFYLKLETTWVTGVYSGSPGIIWATDSPRWRGAVNPQHIHFKALNITLNFSYKAYCCLEIWSQCKVTLEPIMWSCLSEIIHFNKINQQTCWSTPLQKNPPSFTFLDNHSDISSFIYLTHHQQFEFIILPRTAAAFVGKFEDKVHFDGAASSCCSAAAQVTQV